MHPGMHPCMHSCKNWCMHLAYIHACIHACTHACLHASMRASMHAYRHASMHPCLHPCMHTCTHPCMHPCMCSCMHLCMHACIHACKISTTRVQRQILQTLQTPETLHNTINDLNCRFEHVRHILSIWTDQAGGLERTSKNTTLPFFVVADPKIHASSLNQTMSSRWPKTRVKKIALKLSVISDPIDTRIECQFQYIKHVAQTTNLLRRLPRISKLPKSEYTQQMTQNARAIRQSRNR